MAEAAGRRRRGGHGVETEERVTRGDQSLPRSALA